MDNKRLDNELAAIQAMCTEMLQRVYKARKILGCVDTPAPSGGKVKRELSPERQAKLASKRLIAIMRSK